MEKKTKNLMTFCAKVSRSQNSHLSWPGPPHGTIGPSNSNRAACAVAGVAIKIINTSKHSERSTLSTTVTGEKRFMYLYCKARVEARQYRPCGLKEYAYARHYFLMT